MSRYNNVHIGC